VSASEREKKPTAKRGDGLAGLGLDKVIHERARLMILTYLASSPEAEIGFTGIRDELGFTAGNLSVQLRTLEEAGYVEIEKRIVANKSYTGIKLTSSGQRSLKAYLGELEVIVASLKAGASGLPDRKEGQDGGSVA
jgi:DNA-binding MarR family transcriptional regulator